MKVLSSHIQIGAWEFDFVTNIEIVSSWDLLTDTCKIEIPKNVQFKRFGEILTDFIGGDNPIFDRGDQVIVKLGYDGFLKTVFMGRVSDVNAQNPLIISCEDEMYQLKQSFISSDIKLEDTTLKRLIEKMFDEQVSFPPLEEDRVIADIEIGDFIAKNTTVSQVLSYLRKKLGIVSYFRASYDLSGNAAPVFVSGLPYSTEDNQSAEIKKDDFTGKLSYRSNGINAEKTVNFGFGQNIIEDRNLTFKRADDQNILVIGRSKQKDNSLLSYDAGDRGGDVTRINYPYLSKDELQKFVETRLLMSKYDGFSGSFSAFLEPIVRHGESVNMINNDVPEKDGLYLVKSVMTKFGINGGRQIITLGGKLDA